MRGRKGSGFSLIWGRSLFLFLGKSQRVSRSPLAHIAVKAAAADRTIYMEYFIHATLLTTSNTFAT